MKKFILVAALGFASLTFASTGKVTSYDKNIKIEKTNQEVSESVNEQARENEYCGTLTVEYTEFTLEITVCGNSPGEVYGQLLSLIDQL